MRDVTRKLVVGLSIVGLAVVCSAPLKADVLAIATTRAGFNDTAIWPGTCQQDLPSVSTTSTNGVGVTATDATGGIDTDTQVPPGCAYDGWFGNFAPGDHLLYTGAAFGTGSGPMTTVFSRPVSGVGAQYMNDDYGPFTAQISLYNGATLLGSFTEPGVSDGAADNSAIFLGAIDLSGADITSAVFSVVGSGDFAINQLSLREGPLAPVPEPMSVLLLITLLAFACGVVRYHKRLV